MLVTTTQVATTANSLKARYHKYLECLCNANGIDIGTLKANANQIELLEMYFGGMPVMVGMKHFTSLKILRIFAQDIVSLKPLVEVSSTLEELWICEGKLKVIEPTSCCGFSSPVQRFSNGLTDNE
ncbi:unnamed protein product [Anisakis simplex]|uniref:Recep_L_domain domain-containing protein n=1 Tax=Anisakis simplex TaxID=6269 RepID=A0A0M3KJQ2_ANISI|nr:unnamed protein product [Anisakis simplex]